MNISLRDLHVFSEVCKYRSIKQAAKALYVSAQGVSRIIIELEKDLDAQLFVRSPNGLVLTEYGVIYKKYVDAALSQNERVRKAIRQKRKQMDSNISVSCSYVISGTPLLQFLTNFKHQRNGYTLSWQDASDLAVHQQVMQKPDCIGLTVAPQDLSPFRVTPIFSYRYVLLVNSNSAFSNQKTVSAHTLAGLRLATFNNEDMSYHALLSECDKLAFTPELFTISGSSMAYKFCMQSSLNAAVIPGFLTVPFDTSKFTKVIPFDNTFPTWDIVMLENKDSEPSEAMQYFRSSMLEFLQEHKDPYPDYAIPPSERTLNGR